MEDSQRLNIRTSSLMPTTINALKTWQVGLEVSSEVINPKLGYPATWETHLQEACRVEEDIRESPLPVLTGEFSLAVTDCQKYLQGGLVTPYDPVTNNQTCQYYNGDFDNYEADHKEFLQSFFLAQVDSYEAGERGAGWFMWTMKVEGEAGPEWDFLYLWRRAVIPQELCDRNHHCYPAH